MLEADAEAVTALAAELGYANHIEALRGRIGPIAEADLLLIAADSSDRPVAFIQAHQVCIIEVGSRVEIVGLVVSSAARRKGIARALIAEVECWAKKVGAPIVSVRSNTRRTEAHSFYPAMGYKEIKTQAVYEKEMSATGGETL